MKMVIPWLDMLILIMLVTEILEGVQPGWYTAYFVELCLVGRSYSLLLRCHQLKLSI